MIKGEKRAWPFEGQDSVAALACDLVNIDGSGSASSCIKMGVSFIGRISNEVFGLAFLPLVMLTIIFLKFLRFRSLSKA
jgi:hypothetical protein